MIPGWFFPLMAFSLLGTLPSAWRGLKSSAAPLAAYRVVLALYLAWEIATASAAIGWIPWLIPLALVLPLWIILFGGGPRLIELLGGPIDKRHLGDAYNEIIQIGKRGATLTKPEFDRLRRLVVRLNRFRNPETDEFVTLVQREVLDWMDGRSPEESIARAHRINDLAACLWPARKDLAHVKGTRDFTGGTANTGPAGAHTNVT